MSRPDRPLRIVHVVSSLGGGGMEHFVVRLATAQRLEGHDARVLAIRDGPLTRDCAENGVPWRVLGGGGTLSRAARAVLYLARARPHVAHAHNATSLQFAVLAKVVSGARVVLTDHGQTHLRGLVRAPSAFEVAHTDAVAAVSDATLRASSFGHGAPLRTVVYNGVDLPTQPSDRTAMRARLRLADQPIAIMVAAMEPVKRHRVVLDAIARVRGRGARVTLLLVGDGPERSAVEARAAELGLGPDVVRFLGYRTDVGDLLGASDILVLPSASEGLPMCILEAMAHGLPVVASAVGGIPELVQHGRTGLLVPPDDAAALSDALQRLLVDPGARRALGGAGRSRVSCEFSFDLSVAGYDALYARLAIGGRWT
jgi:glycosyltransferase involved in cell wall biosynthesis